MVLCTSSDEALYLYQVSFEGVFCGKSFQSLGGYIASIFCVGRQTDIPVKSFQVSTSP